MSTISAALALAGLEAGPPDVSATIAERERLAAGLRSIGLEPLPSFTNFLLVPHERAQELYEALLARGLPFALRRERSGSPCTGRRRTTGCSRRSPR